MTEWDKGLEKLDRQYDKLFMEAMRERIVELEAERDEQVQWVKDLTDELIKAEAQCNQMQNHRDRANLDLAKAKADLEAAFKAKDLEYEEVEAERDSYAALYLKQCDIYNEMHIRTETLEVERDNLKGLLNRTADELEDEINANYPTGSVFMTYPHNVQKKKNDMEMVLEARAALGTEK